MICEDCLFQLGIEEYEILHTRRGSYVCRRCDEIVPAANVNGNLIEDSIMEFIEKKENRIKENSKNLHILPMSFLVFRNNCCKHFEKTRYKGGGNCHYSNRKKTRKTTYYPDICKKEECPFLKK